MTQPQPPPDRPPLDLIADLLDEWYALSVGLRELVATERGTRSE